MIRLPFNLGRERLSVDDEVFVVQQISLMLKVGISLPKALGILAQHDDGRYRTVFEDVRAGVTAGNTLERSMRRHPETFHPTLLNLVRIGELRGDLSSVLDKYVAVVRTQERLSRKIKGTLMYPAIVLIAMVALGITASLVVFPEIERLFEGFDLELPAVTRAIISFSGFMGRHGSTVIVFLGAALAAAVVLYRRVYAVKLLAHRLVLRMPLVGRLVREHEISSIMRNLGTLLQAGMPITDVLEACRASAANITYKLSLEEAAAQLHKGNQLHTTFSRYPALYPSVAVELLAVGEETGRLQDVCGDLAVFYEERVFSALELLPTIIEPILIFIIGGGVALIAVSILLPMYSFSASI